MCPGSDDYWREPRARYVPWVDRLPLVPFEMAISVLFRLFGHSGRKEQIQAALAYPSSRSGQNGRNTRRTLVYGF